MKVRRLNGRIPQPNRRQIGCWLSVRTEHGMAEIGGAHEDRCLDSLHLPFGMRSKNHCRHTAQRYGGCNGHRQRDACRANRVPEAR